MKKIAYFFLALGLQIIFCCSGKETSGAEVDELAENIVGQWDSQWEMTGEEVKEYPARQRKMSGEMVFKNNGEVEVTTYGFEGCIFMSDTATNKMNWKIENQVLRFMDKKDVHGIPYSIESIRDDRIELMIMENIHLTLTR